MHHILLGYSFVTWRCFWEWCSRSFTVLQALLGEHFLNLGVHHALNSCLGFSGRLFNPWVGSLMPVGGTWTKGWCGAALTGDRHVAEHPHLVGHKARSGFYGPTEAAACWPRVSAMAFWPHFDRQCQMIGTKILPKKNQESDSSIACHVFVQFTYFIP